MVVNRKVTGKALPIATGIALGAVGSLGITLLGAAVTANLILSEKLEPTMMGYGALLILLLASIMGAWISAAMTKRRRMMVCMGAGGSYYLILLAITALFFGGQYQGMGVTALVILAGSATVGLLGLRGEKSGRNKAKKRHFR